MPKSKQEKPKLLVILGPTASGKSTLAVKLAKKLNGEVVSADSRQVYKGLDIGTGKITKKEMGGIKHHLLDVADPKKRFSVVEYVKLADRAIEGILKRGKLPIICGGTGFYIQALVDGIVLPEVPVNQNLRKSLEKKTPLELLKMLKKLDKKRGEEIANNDSDKHNARRIIRAIEIAQAHTMVPLQKVSKYDPVFIGIDAPRSELREKISDRLSKRLKAGMLDEAKRLHNPPAGGGLSWKRMEELGLEYRYMARYLQGKISKEEMVERLNIEIGRYAKRQMTWFRKDKRIKWVKLNEAKTHILKYI